MGYAQIDVPAEKFSDMGLSSLAVQLVLAEPRLGSEAAVRAVRTSADFTCFEVSGYVGAAGVATVVRVCFDFRFSHLHVNVSN